MLTRLSRSFVRRSPLVPICSMVADYIDKHPEYADITDPG